MNKVDYPCLIDGRMQFGCGLGEWPHSEHLSMAAALLKVDIPEPTKLAALSNGVYARVEHGRWIVDCANPVCIGGVEAVWLEEPKAWCGFCGNKDIEGLWRPVFLPQKSTLYKITRLLLARPRAGTRNWTNDDPAASQLEKENEENNISLDHSFGQVYFVIKTPTTQNENGVNTGIFIDSVWSHEPFASRRAIEIGGTYDCFDVDYWKSG